MHKFKFNFKIIFTSIVIASIAILIFSQSFTPAQAATGINRQINFQGKLVNNPSATNVTNTSYTVVFTLYDNASGATQLWQETQSVTTTDGIFRVALGSVTPFPANFNFNWSGLYLGMKVNADSEMTPRIQMAAVPFAFNAEKVAGLTVQDTSGNASTSGTLQVGNGKTISFSDNIAFGTGTTGTISLGSSTNTLTLTTSGNTTLALPTSGTLCTTVSCLTSDPYWNQLNGSLFANNSTVDFLFGSQASISANFHLFGASPFQGTQPVASIAANTSFAAMVVDQSGLGDLFTASAAGNPLFVIKKNGNVGINTSNPTSGKLQITGATAETGISIGGITTGTGITMALTTGTGISLTGTLSTGTGISFSGAAAATSGTAISIAGSNSGSIIAFSGNYLSINPTRNRNQTGNVTDSGSFVNIARSNTVSNAGATYTVSGDLVKFSSNCTVTSGQCIDTGKILSLTQSYSSASGSVLFIANSGKGLAIEANSAGNTIAVASFSGQTSFATLVVNNDGVGDLFTASKSGLALFTVKNNGQLTLGAPYYQTCTLKTVNGLVTCDVDNTGGGGTNWWNQLAGALSPVDTTNDFLLGSTATSSALFSFTGIQTGQTIASISGNLIVMPNNGWGGQVGIGTTGPTALLHVVQTSASDAFRVDDAVSDTTPFIIDQFGNTLIGTTATSGKLTVAISSGSEVLALVNSDNSKNWGFFPVTNGSNTDMLFAENSNYRITFQSGGNVGIGTTTPLATLDVRANTTSGGTISVASASGKTSFAALVANNDGVGDLFTASSSGTNKFSIARTGIITAPYYNTCTLKTDSAGIISCGTDNTGGSGGGAFAELAGAIVPLNSTEDFLIGGQATASAKFAVLGVNTGQTIASVSGQFIVMPQNGWGGNVGIGTTAPSAALHVASKGLASTPAFRLDGTWFTGGTSTTTKPQLLIEPAGTTSTNWADNGTAIGVNSASGFVGDLLNVQVNNSKVMSLDSGGRLIVNGVMAGVSNSDYFKFSGAASSTNYFSLNPTSLNSGNILDIQKNSISRLSVHGDGKALLTLNEPGDQDILSASVSGVTKVTIKNDGSIGVGTTNTLATLDVRGNSGTIPVASVSGKTSFAALVVDQSGLGDLFTASKSGLAIFTVKNNGQLTLGAPYYTATCTLKTDNTGLITCGTDNTGSGGGYSPFQELEGAIVPNNSTMDFLIGGQSTISAKFAFINSASSLVPVASISATTSSGGSGTGLVLNGEGTIQSLLNAPLTLGGNTTGNINLSPLNGRGSVSIVSDLSQGARSGYALDIIQASNGSNNNSVGLLRLSNSDTGSTQALLTLTQVASGDGISISNSLGAGTGLSISGISTGTGINIPTAKTAGTALHISSIGDTASGISIGGPNTITTSFTGNMFKIDSSRTFSSAGSINDTGNWLNLIRNNTVNNAGATYTVSGDLATLSSNCTKTSGECVDTGKILSLTQSYASASGSVLFISNSGKGLAIEANSTGNTVPVASISGQTSFAALVVNNDGVGDLFTASKSGLALFTVKNNGQLTLGAPYYTATCTLKTDSTGLITCSTDLQGGGSSPFAEITGGVIVPNNSTVDFLIGSQATASAKFAVLGVNTGQTIASVSGQFIVMPQNGWGGQVGIGTNNPLKSLDIRGSIASGNLAASIQNNDTSGSSGIFIGQDASSNSGTNNLWLTYFGSTYPGVFLPRSNQAALFANSSATNGILINTWAANAPIIFATEGFTSSSNEKMRITGVGNIGINITSPLAALDIRPNTTNGGTIAVASTSGKTSFAALVANNDGVGDLFTASSSGTNKFSVQRNGLLLAPTYATCTLKTDLNGLFTCGTDNTGSGGGGAFTELAGAIVPLNSTEDFLIGGQSTTSAKFAVLGVNTGQTIASVSGNFIVMPQNGWGGQVGIGTTTPVAPLDVRGQAIISKNANTIDALYDTLLVGRRPNNDAYSSLRLSPQDSTARGWKIEVFDDNTTAHYFKILNQVAATTPFFINSSGNVGIGTVTPTALLDVTGTASVGGQLTFRSGTAQVQSTANQGLILGGDTTGNISIAPLNGGAGSLLTVNALTTNFSGAITGVTTLAASGAIAANGGITFDGAGDTLGAFTMAGNIIGGSFIITDIGSTGTDFDTSGGLSITTDAAGTALTVDNAANASSIFVAEDNNTPVFTIVDGGDITWAAGTPTITINAAETFTISNGTAADNFVYNTSTNALTLGDGTNGLTFDIDTGMTYQGSGRKTKTIHLAPEYPGAVLTASGSATTNGSMTSDASPSATFQNYYEWSSTQASLQDYTVAVHVELPADFSAWSTNAITVEFNTATTNAPQNKFDFILFNTSDASPKTPVVMRTANVSSVANTWQTLTITGAALTSGTATLNTPGHEAVIYLKMYAGSPGYVQVGDIELNYLSAF